MKKGIVIILTCSIKADVSSTPIRVIAVKIGRARCGFIAVAVADPVPELGGPVGHSRAGAHGITFILGQVELFVRAQVYAFSIVHTPLVGDGPRNAKGIGMVAKNSIVRIAGSSCS